MCEHDKRVPEITYLVSMRYTVYVSCMLTAFFPVLFSASATLISIFFKRLAPFSTICGKNNNIKTQHEQYGYFNNKGEKRKGKGRTCITSNHLTFTEI